MKFLFLYKFDPNYHFDKYFHLDLVKHYTKAGHKSMCYGPKIHEAYPEECIQEFNPNTTLTELYEKFPFDVVICLTQSRMFDYYRPVKVIPIQPEKKEGCWLPKDFQVWVGRKVVLEEDYHYEDNNDWYKEMGINLVLQRHYSNVKRFYDNDNKGIKCIWHPFSVDEEIFKPIYQERINKFCMIGSVVKHIYPLRTKIIEELKPLSLLDYPGRKFDQDYIDCLQSYIGHVSCSSIFNITPAKMFEIMASGSVLFTDKNDYGLEYLFPKDSYITYKPDCSDLKEKVTYLLNNPLDIKNLTNKARKCILERHTHKIRINEMVDIIEKEFNIK